MRYIKTFLLVLFLMPTVVFAAGKKSKSSSDFHKGTALLDFTIGSPTSVGPFNRKVIMPPVSFSLDVCGIDGLAKGKGAIAFGGIMSYYINDVWGRAHYYYHDVYYDRSYFYFDAEQHNLFIAFRADYHFQPVSKLDIYGGLLMGGHWKIWNYVDRMDYHRYYNEHPSKNRFCFGPFVGVHYYFSQSFGVKAEFGADTGGGLPYAQAGIGFKIK